MTVEELKEEADRQGFKLVKKPEYNCTCWVKRHYRLDPENYYFKAKCRSALYVGVSRQGCTHCIKIKEES